MGALLLLILICVAVPPLALVALLLTAAFGAVILAGAISLICGIATYCAASIVPAALVHVSSRCAE